MTPRERDTYAGCSRCGHSRAHHHNHRCPHTSRQVCDCNRPCHHLGRHDMRCTCRGFVVEGTWQVTK